MTQTGCEETLTAALADAGVKLGQMSNDMERILADRDKWLDLAASRARQNAELQRKLEELEDEQYCDSCACTHCERERARLEGAKP